MSASAPGARPSFSATGYADGLGRRTLVFDRQAGARVERLTLRPEFGAFERALRERAAHLATWEGDGVARPRRVHRNHPCGPLHVDADLPAGDRLSDVLDAAAEGRSDQPLAGVTIALGCLADVLRTLDRLHRHARVVHGALAPGRLLLTPSGHVVLLDALYGDVLGRLGWPPARLWRELGIAAAGPASAQRRSAGDLAQAGLVSLALLLGRPLATGEWAERVPAAMTEAREIAELHGGVAFAAGLQALFSRLLPSASDPFPTAADALREVRALAEAAMGSEACATALASAADAMAILPAPEAPDVWTAPAAAPRIASRSEPPARMTLAPVPLDLQINIPPPPEPPAPSATTAESRTVTPAAPPPVEAVAPAVQVVSDEPSPARPALVGPESVTPVAPPEDVRPVTVPEPRPEPVAAAPAREPEKPKAASPRRSKRDRRRKDALRSSTPAAATSPSPPAPVEIAPPPRPPLIAVRPPQPPAFPQPVYPQPGGYGTGGAMPASPYLEASDRAGLAVPVVSAHPPTVALQSVPLQPPAAPIAVQKAPIAVKADPAVRPKKARMAPGPYDSPTPALTPPPPTRTAGTHWKIAAAALVVLAAGIAAGRAYLPERTGTVTASSDAAEPVAPAATAPSTGTLLLSSTPAGARVLVDGIAAGETPLTLNAVTPGRRTITFVASSGSVTRTIPVAAGETVTLDVPVFSGWLAVDAPIVLEVAQDGRVIGTTQGRLLMPPGRHSVTLANADLGYRTRQVVDILPGEERRLSLIPATEVNLNASPWAEVWIDGKRVGETPIGRVSIPLGTREITFRHPQFGERRLTPTIRVGDPAAISVDFTRPGQQ